MKRVSFKVAKMLKEAGYPQEYDSPCYVTEDCIKKYDLDYDGDMPIIGEREYNEGQYINRFSYRDKECDPPHCYAPTYLDVWLWLWREKHVKIVCGSEYMTSWHGDSLVPLHSAHTKDPEESIGKEIEYLFDNNMIELTNG